MDDLSSKLNHILSDPQSMEQIKNIMGSMGLSGAGGEQSQPAPAINEAPAAAPLGTEMLGAFTKLAPILSKVQKEDNSTRLLQALRPMLSPPKQKKIDEAMKILHLIKLWPLIKDSGILGSLFG